MRYLIILFLFPITFYGQVAIGSATTVDPDVILDLTNNENRGLLLNKTPFGPIAPVGNIFFNTSKNMIGVVGDLGNYYLSPWRHTDTNEDVTYSSDSRKVIIKNSDAANPGRIILEVEDGSINVEDGSISVEDGSINVINGKIKEKGYDLVPAGCIMMWGGTISPPLGWLDCNGEPISRIGIYKALFDIIGETYGNGNGSTTFNLPNFNDKFPKGSSPTNASGTKGGDKEFAITKANLPNISHTHSIDHNHSIDHGHDDSETSEDGKHRHDTNIDYGSGSDGTNNNAGSTLNAATGAVNTAYQADHKHDTDTPAFDGDSGGASNGDSGSSPATTPTSTAYKSTPIDNQPEFLQIQYIIKY